MARKRKRAEAYRIRAVEFLLEERSAERVLKIILPRMFQPLPRLTYRVFEGKGDLLSRLPELLRAYRHRIAEGENLRIVILLDQDAEDCLVLKSRLNQYALEAQLVPYNHQQPSRAFHVLSRIAIEELEAWYFGDIQALSTAYPKIVPYLGKLKERSPNSISDTAEVLEKILKQAGYHRNGMPKIEVAERVAQHMQPERNRARSFQVFREGLEACLT